MGRLVTTKMRGHLEPVAVRGASELCGRVGERILSTQLPWLAVVVQQPHAALPSNAQSSRPAAEASMLQECVLTVDDG